MTRLINTKSKEEDSVLDIHSFLGRDIISIGYLCNLDESADYIYITLQSGYAILYKPTLEVLEYSLTSFFPYESVSKCNYYLGPGKYYIKENNAIKDLKTGEIIDYSIREKQEVSNSIREVFDNKIDINLDLSMFLTTNRNTPNYDNGNKIHALDTEDITYIDNYEYFSDYNPSHGYNQYGTCGSVAVQLL